MMINNKGFTLIEIVVVLMIISLIASIAVPNIMKIQSQAKEKIDQANRQTLKNAAKICYINENKDSKIEWTKSNEFWKDYLDNWPEYPIDKNTEYVVKIEKGKINVVLVKKGENNE